MFRNLFKKRVELTFNFFLMVSFLFRPKLSSYTPADLLVSGNITLAYEKIVKIVGVAEAVLMKDIETFATLRESAKDHVFGTGQVAGVVQVFPN